MRPTFSFLDINALAEAEESKKAKLLSSYQNADSAALDVNDYFLALINCQTRERGLSAKDVKRKEFHTNY